MVPVGFRQAGGHLCMHFQDQQDTKGALKCSFFAVAALVGAGLLSCCLLRQPASFTAQPTNEQFQDPLNRLNYLNLGVAIKT